MTKAKQPPGVIQTPRLQLRRIGIDTYRENVAYLHRDCHIYRAEGFQALSRVFIGADGGHILAVLNVVDDEAIVSPDELGLSEQAFVQLGLDAGTPVRIEHAEPPKSMGAVRRKIIGESLSQQDFDTISRDIVEHRYSKMEIAAFLVACSQSGLERDEILYLTRSMLESGKQLDWDENLVADKHCIGGVPGNRASMLIVPIVSAHGMLIPKTSSRAITSPAGTADTMEVLANVELQPEQLRHLIHKERGFIVWGGTSKLAPVDDILISVERPLEIDSMGQLVASILAKKLAAGSTHLLIDIPVGPTAKVRKMNEALQLRKLFEFVGDQLGLHTEVIITDGKQPIGRGIGPALEARDVMQVLANEPNAPHDLRQRALQLAGRIIEFDPDVRGGQGYAIARDILDSGRALEKMQRIISGQGATTEAVALGSLTHEVCAPHSGMVESIDNLQMARIARMAGAPMDKGAGVDLSKKLGDAVNKGELLYRIHAEFRSDFQFACDLAHRDSGYTIAKEKH